MKKVAHNMAISTSFNDEVNQYMHNLSIVISDVNDETQTIDKSEQINMFIMPAMQPEQLIMGLREFTDHIEKYINGELHKENQVKKGAANDD